MAKLNDRQQKFCDEYLIDLNATQAAIRAGYSEKTAKSIGQRLLTYVDIQNYISERKQDRVERTEITQDMVLKELALIAFSKATDYASVVEKTAYTQNKDGERVPMIDANGKPITFKTVEAVLTEELTEDQKRALASVKEGKNGIEVKPHDKVRALELLGKHMGMWTDNLQVTGNVNNPMQGLSTEDLKKLIDDD
jgi:phage terminase small subunit